MGTIAGAGARKMTPRTPAHSIAHPHACPHARPPSRVLAHSHAHAPLGGRVRSGHARLRCRVAGSPVEGNWKGWRLTGTRSVGRVPSSFSQVISARVSKLQRVHSIGLVQARPPAHTEASEREGPQTHTARSLARPHTHARILTPACTLARAQARAQTRTHARA